MRPAYDGVKAGLAFTLAFLSAVQAQAIVLGLCRVPLAWWSAWLVLCIAAVPGVILARAQLRRAETGRDAIPRRMQTGILIAMLALLAVALILSVVRNDTAFDSNAYHTPPINQWAAAGYIHDVSDNFSASEVMNGYPRSAEAVTFVFVKAFGGYSLGLLNWLYAPLGFFGIALLCRLFGAGRRDSYLFGAAYLLVPANLLEYGTTYVDAAFGSCVIALLALLAANLVAAGRSSLYQDVHIGLAAAHVISVKGSGLVVGAVAIAVYLICRLSFDRSRDLPVSAARIGAVVLVLGGYWYARDYALHGSPVYPIGVTVAKRQIFPGMTSTAVLNIERMTPRELKGRNGAAQVLLSWLATLDPRRWVATEVDRRLGGLGTVWLLGCLPAITACLFLVRSFTPSQRVAYLFLIATVLVAFLGIPMNWWARYTVWIFGVGLAAMSIVLHRHGRASQTAVAVCALLLIVQASLLLGKLTYLTVAGLTQPVAPIPAFPSLRGPLLVHILQAERAIGIGPRALGPNVTMYGQLSHPVGAHDIIPISSSVRPPEIQAWNARNQLHYILWLTAAPIPAALAPLVETKGAEGEFTYLRILSSR